MTPEDLESYLLEQRSEGELALGEGEFSLDARKAGTKLGLYALPEPGLWVVKLVQAAVVVGAPEIKFVLERRKVKVVFENRANWEADELLKLVLSAKTPQDRALFHLQTGLLSAASGLSEQIAWACGEGRIILTKSGVKRGDNPNPNKVTVVSTRPKNPSEKANFFSSPLRYYFKQTAHEFKALVDHCRYAPISLLVDGHSLPRFYGEEPNQLPTSPGYDSDRNEGSKKALALLPFFGYEQADSLPYPLEEVHFTRELTTWAEFAAFAPVSLPAPQGAQAVMALYLCLQRECRINYICDGALISRRVLSQEDGTLMRKLLDCFTTKADRLVFDLYVSVPVENLDLSHFQLSEPPLEQLLAPLLPSLMKTLEEAAEATRLPWKDYLKQGGFPEIRNASPTDIATGVFASMFIPHALVLGSAYLVISPFLGMTKPYRDKRRGKELVKTLEGIIEKLRLLLDSEDCALPHSS